MDRAPSPTVFRLTFQVEAAREEELVTALWEAGTTGVQVRGSADTAAFDTPAFDPLPEVSGTSSGIPSGTSPEGSGTSGGPVPGVLRVEAYFDTELVDEAARVAEAAGGRLLVREVVPDQDWLATWKAQARPFPVGRRLWIDPREPDDGVEGDEAPEALDVPDGRTLLRIPARAAFGTGSHETTRLVLELLEDLEEGAGEVSGRSVVDVGTGTGILAFLALVLGARRAVAFDIDPASPLHAHHNLLLNRASLPGLEGRLALLAGTTAALAPSPERPGRPFDLALVNIIPEHFLPELPGLRPLLAPGALALFSGILAERQQELAERLTAEGFAPADDLPGLPAHREMGEWTALVTRYTPPWASESPP